MNTSLRQAPGTSGTLSEHLQSLKEAQRLKGTNTVTTKPKAINPANKERKVDHVYAHWTDPRTNWTYWLLKSWQADNAKAYARWFMFVKGWGDDYGDTYVADLLPGLLRSDDLTFDLNIWPTRAAFIAWAKGSKS